MVEIMKEINRASNAEDIRYQCRSLAVMWPALLAAIPKDSSSPGANARLSHTGSISYGIVVNPDVLDVAQQLTVEIPSVCDQVREAIQAVAVDGVPGTLLALPGWHTRLHAKRQTELAELLVGSVSMWHSMVRRCLGFTPGGQVLQDDCPNHDEPLEKLQIAPRVGQLHESIVEGRYKQAVIHADMHGRMLPEAVRWQKATMVFCWSCGERWASLSEIAVLVRRLDEARQRRDQVNV